MKEKILDLLNQKNYRAMDIKQLMELYHLNSSEDLKILMKCLNQLEDECIIARNDKNQYDLIERLGYIKGTIRVNPKGFGFIDLDNASYYVDKSEMMYAMDKDEVLAKITLYEYNEASVVRILKRNTTKVVGCIREKKGRKIFYADSKNFNYDFKITNMNEVKVVDQDKVLVKIDHYGKVLKGHIEKIIGSKYDPGVDVLSILLEKNIDPIFSDEVYQEVQRVVKPITKEEISKRVDLRSLLTITIDGDDAKDLDDAISVEKVGDIYRLYVHIADVSYYVQENSPIDIEAYKRGTSVYVVDRVVPMLPHALCNGICSLNPNEDRLSITCMMEINKKGEVESERIFPSVIHSNNRMTYNDVNKILNGHKKLQKKYSHLLKMLLDMKVLANLIRRRRNKLGAIDFDVKEGKVLVDNKGVPYDVILRERKESEMMIEDFMLSANESVARVMKWMDIPSIYRIHEQPEAKKMRDFIAQAKVLGYSFHGGIQTIYPNQLQAMLNEAKGCENYDVLSRLMLRSMQKARYENQCLGHFGLALNEYLHFTSPIRRYPDLIVHRMLRKYLFNHEQDLEQMKKDMDFCNDAAIQSSNSERNAIDAEREVDDMKKAQYMEKHIGQIYEGIISGVMKFGIFVELENTIEGLVRVEELPYDKYIYDEQNKRLTGIRKQKSYCLGQKVIVQCIGANRFLKEIDFTLIEDEGVKGYGKKGRRF